MHLAVNGASVPLTMHTGRPKPTNETSVYVVWKNFQPAQPQPQSGGHAAMLELLLQLPPFNEEESVDHHHILLSVEIQKQLLTVFDVSPDASRGIDLPAAQITLVPPLPPPPPLLQQHSSSSSFSSSSSQTPHTAEASEKKTTRTSASLLISSALGCPLSLNKHKHENSTDAAGGVVQRRTSLHLINLPIPDASMPFNVVCFTSTAIAVTFGSVLNVLLLKPRSKADAAGGYRRALKMRLLRGALMLVLVGCTAIYMDKDLQRKANAFGAPVLHSFESIFLSLAAAGNDNRRIEL